MLGAQDGGGEWRLLESQTEQHLAQDEQFLEGAVDDLRCREKFTAAATTS